MLISLIVACVLGLAAAGVALWLAASRKGLLAQQERLEQQVQAAEQLETTLRDQNQTLAKQLSEAQSHVAVAQASHLQLTEQFDKAQVQLKDTFKAMAGDALKQSQDQFLNLAKKTFEGEQKDAVAQLEQRKAAIEASVKPLGLALDKYNATIRQIETSRSEAYGKLTEQVGALMVDQRRLREETGNLVKALRRPDVRGKWGEMQLRRVAEMAGMIEHCDFSQQVSASATEDERGIRPDMVVTLPNHRSIIIDAKTPLDAFLSAVDATDEKERDERFAQHTRHIETHVRQLASKEYQQRFAGSADFVILFIPGDSFLFPAVQQKPTLIENAMAQGVIIATPTTLISLLKVVAMGWREEQITQNALKISEAGKELHNRLCVAVDHMQKLGKALDNATGFYNKFVGSFESRVMVQARKFEELGADSSKKLPEALEQIEKQPKLPSNFVDSKKQSDGALDEGGLDESGEPDESDESEADETPAETSPAVDA